MSAREAKSSAPPEPSLRFTQRYSSPSAGLILEVSSLRRPEFALRSTTYRNVVVDERLLTASFPFVSPSSRVIAAVMMSGVLDIDEGGETLRVGPGEAALLGVSSMRRTRWERAVYVDLEWAPRASSARAAGAKPTRLRTPERDRVAKLAAALADRSSDQRATLADAFDLFRSIGAPLELSVEALEGEPTDRDRGLALAIEEQLQHLSSRATTLHISDSMRLSPRQIHRLVEEFCTRYGMNATNWRDARNRFRLQFAALLLSVPGTTVATIAAEVGYASPNALARAFAKAGFPPPRTPTTSAC